MSDNTLPQKILIVDADKSVGQGIKGPLEKHKIKVDCASDLSTGLYMFNQNMYTVVLIELSFEELPGLVLVQRWRAHESVDKRSTSFILVAGNRDGHDPAKAKLIEELDDIEVIYKPLNPIHILPMLKKAMMTRTRRMRFSEVSAQATKLAARPESVQTAIDFVKSNLKDLGPRGHDLLREMYEVQKSYPKAMEVVDGILLQKPENLNAINHKGRLLLKLGRPDDALKYMEHADKLAPNNIERLNEMAMAYLEANNPDMSVKQMRELIRYHPDKPEVKFDMFARLQEFGFDDHAIALCKDTTDPLEVVRHYNNKGVALAKGGNIEGAIMEYERSLRFYPKYKENYRILYNIALAHLSYKTRSHYEIALDYIMRCLELNEKFDKAIKTKEQIEDQLSKRNKTAS
ncbi:tetratricopeptide repeat protein [Oligoflexus tunisiensis]|uniref:tetratricopeptide repeat protein n=1 Tax=Oligoflexus tunisiensis TaxID=708132 RepID=UPI00114D10D5|nr:tetratricopeptide repeat protein [Oligoflexus tunisiensis]